MTNGAIPFATEFRLPMRDLDKRWYEATRRFGRYNSHPEKCEDWNLESGGDTDLGERLVAPFAGIVSSAKDHGGAWGKVIQIVGWLPDGARVIWMGAHLRDMFVSPYDIVTIGQEIGTIGTAGGRYAAHLHEQIAVGRVPEPYVFAADARYDFRQPSVFYVEHGVDAELVRRVTEFDGR